MIMLALVSDLHANQEAVSAVLKDIEEEGLDDVACLGDVVGYGPDPAEVADLARKFFKFTLMGNHDRALFREPVGFNPGARSAVLWTRSVLKPGLFAGSERKARWSFLERLLLKMTLEDYLFVHASPQDPTDEYLLRSDVDEITHALSPKLVRAFQEVPRACFVGHTHQPGVITEDGHWYSPSDLPGGRWEIKAGQRVIVNVGSVGQPRDGDTRASYAILEDDVVTFRRVEYDVEACAKKIYANPKIDDRMGQRLQQGI